MMFFPTINSICKLHGLTESPHTSLKVRLVSLNDAPTSLLQLTHLCLRLSNNSF